MPLVRQFRQYGVTIHDKTTREVAVPEYEIGVIRAAWRGTEITVTATNDIKEVVVDPALVYRSLLNRYSRNAVTAFFPGPERLEQDMQAAAEKTAAWLVEKKRVEDADIERSRKLIRDSTPKDDAGDGAPKDPSKGAAKGAAKK